MASPPDMTTVPTTRHAWLCGVLSGAFAAIWCFGMSGWLGVQPGHAPATRPDVLFQNDAGMRIQDLKTGESSFGRGSHPLMALLWTRPLHAIAGRFEDPETAAVIVSRVYAALGTGIGIGSTVGCLLACGVSIYRLLALALLWMGATSQAVASLPEHFAWSAGLLPAAWGVFLATRRGVISFRTGVTLLFVMIPFTAGVCITNGLWPAGLTAFLLAQRARIRMRIQIGACLVLALSAMTLIAVIHRYGAHWPIAWQAQRWLHLRLLHDPLTAGTYVFRGIIDPIVGPTPAIESNNDDQRPMLTYEQRPYPIWPYAGFRNISVLAWLSLLGVSLVVGLRSGEKRNDMIVLLLGIGANLLFHNLWGDEFFLYSPHYAWALMAVVICGWPRGKRVWAIPLLVLVIAGQVLTGLEILRAVQSIPV